MDKVRTSMKIAALVLMNLVTVTLSIELFVYSVGLLKLGQCASSYGTLSCDIYRTQDIHWLPYLVLLTAAVTALIATLMFFSRQSAMPFFLFMIVILMFCTCFDLTFQLPVRNFSRLFGSTYNLTTVVVFFSFLFMMVIVRFDTHLGWRFFGAMMQSYLMRDVAFVFYAAVQGLYAGMTSLYLMFVAFAFGAFTIHIMSIAGILRRSAELRDTEATFQQ
jgi:hypothetical protein